MMKRIICFMMAVVAAGLLVACGSENQPSTDHSQSGDKDSQSVNKDTETVSPPDAPTEALQYMDYHTAYNTLEDVTEQVASTIVGIPSSVESAEASITEFSTQAELEALHAQYANLGYRDDDEIRLTEGDYYFFFNYYVESKATDNRYFWLDNPKYSAYMVPNIDSVRYDADTDSLYVMLAYRLYTYESYEQNPKTQRKVINEAKNAYYTVSLSIGNAFTEPVEHIAFVSPEEKAVSRTDINVSVVEYDEKYSKYELFNYQNNGIDANSYSFASTKAPAGAKAEVITSKEMFVSLLKEYNDIVDSSEDTVIFEPCYVDYDHRTNGLTNFSKEGELLNLFISAPELDSQSVVVAGNLMQDSANKNNYVCAVFYDAETQTAYLHMEYTGYPHTQYEQYTDRELIEENSKATYVMLSIEFCNDEDRPVSNIVIVLPEQTAE